MPIDPSIPLGIRPQQIVPLQLQTPLDRYQKMLTLRSLMDQQQYRQLQAQQTQQEIATAQQEAARDTAFRQHMAGGGTLTSGQAYGLFGATKGGQFLSQQLELESKKESRAINNLRLIGQAAFSAKDQRDRDFKIKLLVSGGAIPQEMADEFLKRPFDLAETQAFGQQLMTIAEQKHAEIEAKTRAFQEKKEPYELKQAQYAAQTAEQGALGTSPISPQQAAQAKAQLWASPGGLLTIINDPNTLPDERARAEKQLKGHQELLAIEAGTRANVLDSPEKIAQEERKARWKADLDIELEQRKAALLGAKPMSAEAATKKALVDTLVVEGKRLQDIIRRDGRKAIAGILTGLDTDISRKATNFADLLGRLRSQGAVSLPEEARFRGMIARWGDLRTGDMQPAIDALDSIMAEANRVSTGINPKGGATPSPGDEVIIDWERGPDGKLRKKP